jgi:hypothetical protein
MSTNHTTPANGGQILTTGQVEEIMANWSRTSNSRFELCRAIEAATLRASLAAPAIPTVDRDAVLEEAVAVCELEYRGNPNGLHLISQGFAAKIRALKSAAPASAPTALTTEQVACMGFDAFRILQGMMPRTYSAKQIADALAPVSVPQPAAPEDAEVKRLRDALNEIAGTRPVPTGLPPYQDDRIGPSLWTTQLIALRALGRHDGERFIAAAPAVAQPAAQSDEPTDREALIACLEDDAAKLSDANPDDEMAQTMREAAAMLEADVAQPAAQVAVQEPAYGDVLPQVGSKVLIHLAREDKWAEHTVTGYYAWGDLGGDPALHRVFVRVVDSEGCSNARLLRDVRPVATPATVKTAEE